MDKTVIRALTGTREHPVLTFRRVYRARPAEVRGACTSIERLARWFGQVQGSPTRVGDRFRALLSDDPDDAAEGRVLRCDDDTIAVTWSWQGEPQSVLTAHITPVDEQSTELTLRHALAHPDHAVGYGGGWEQILQSLARSLDAAAIDAPPDDRIEADAVQRWRSITRAPLEIERLVRAPADRVWTALATAEGMRSWWWRHWEDVTIEADVRVGGAYTIEAPGAGIVLDGTYLAVDAPSHLAFTWRWRDEDGTSADEAVDIHVHAEGENTRITLRHTGPWPDDAPAQSYRQGWQFVLDELTSVLAG